MNTDHRTATQEEVGGDGRLACRAGGFGPVGLATGVFYLAVVAF